MTKVKICGITNLEDAQTAVRFGADALGFNFFKGSSRYIAPESARAIVLQLPEDILTVGVFVNESIEVISRILEAADLDAAQLHGDESPDFAEQLKQQTGRQVIKALRVGSDFDINEVTKFKVDAILLDAFSASERGGTGETFDWNIIRSVQKIFPRTYIAGGLSSWNVRDLIRRVSPFAVDACSGLELTKGKKHKLKVFEFISAAKALDRKFPIEDIYDLLIVIGLRPSMYLVSCTVTSLRSYLDGFESALSATNATFPTRLFFSDFGPWAVRKLTKQGESNVGWSGEMLRRCDDNEEKALELFFELLYEFKAECEKLNDA